MVPAVLAIVCEHLCVSSVSDWEFCLSSVCCNHSPLCQRRVVPFVLAFGKVADCRAWVAEVVASSESSMASHRDASHSVACMVIQVSARLGTWSEDRSLVEHEVKLDTLTTPT